ncbi:MAG TPA: hypothetical protein VGL61_08060 [Kofleriaceae bacterium]|jgi:hypothetical protein
MKWALVAVVACSAPAPVSQAPRVVEPTGPELVTSAPGATAFMIDGSAVYWAGSGHGWRFNRLDIEPPPIPTGSDKVVASGNPAVFGTSTTLYQGSDATPVDGGVRALAVDGDDVFFGNTSIFEKFGRGPINKLGPAGGPVTAMAVDPTYVYWAIGSGERDPAIYRAKRAKPELELFTRVGSASQLIVAGGYLYWLDPAEGAIHRIRRQK